MGSPSRPRRARSWATLTLLALVGGCEEDRASPRESPQAPEAPIDRAAPIEPAPSPWPTEVRPLEASVADFESLEACVASMRESVPVEVAELFYDLGYDDALGEVCRSIQAVATADPAHCDALVSSTVRRQCRTRLAALHEKPEACPEAPGSNAGRDPTCLAWSLRDASLCDGASAGDRIACLAVATDDADRCEDPLGIRSVASCRAMVARLDGLVDADAPPRRPAPELAIDESEPALALPENAARSLERGVVATVEGCVLRTEVSTHPTVGSPRGQVGLTLELRFAEGGATLGSGSEVAIGPVGIGYALRGEVDLDGDAEPTPGAPLQATFTATYTRDGTEHTLKGHVRTFFRDAAPLPSACTR